MLILLNVRSSLIRGAPLLKGSQIYPLNESVTNIFHRGYAQKSNRELLEERYRSTKALFQSKKLPQDVNPEGVFACNELDLSEVKVYGFDYDYTLADYKPSLEHLLYNIGRDMLLEKYKYPSAIAKLEYKPNFAVRGLHYDIEKGLLMKLDSFLQIQLDTVYRGLTPVPAEEVLNVYKNRIIPIAFVEGDVTSHKPNLTKMVHLSDLFSVPEMNLLCNVADYFIKNQIEYSPEILFLDVQNSLASCHPIMHKVVARNLHEYIRPNPNLRKYFELLLDHDKKLFLVTNSPYSFVNAGMKMLVGNDWLEFFDVVVVSAKKPSFFVDPRRPMRVFDKKSNTRIWEKVTSLQKGVIYSEGSVKQLEQLTGWKAQEILYFGDHPYSDLADVTLMYGWHTGAIISELSHEISVLNNKEFKASANWLQMLTQLIEECQSRTDAESSKLMDDWIAERDELRNKIKVLCNPQFGSVFRTYHHATYFSRRLFRFADIYTSNIKNMLNYSPTHSFFPRRGVMPHEYVSLFV